MNRENYIGSIRKYVGHKPLLTIGAWVLVINEKEEVLMQLRTDFNSWDFPGGTMELGETDVAKYAGEIMLKYFNQENGATIEV